MGLFDKAREAAEALAAQQTASGLAAVDAELPPDAPRARIDRIAVAAGHGPATLARYIGQVGLQHSPRMPPPPARRPIGTFLDGVGANHGRIPRFAQVQPSNARLPGRPWTASYRR